MSPGTPNGATFPTARAKRVTPSPRLLLVKTRNPRQTLHGCIKLQKRRPGRAGRFERDLLVLVSSLIAADLEGRWLTGSWVIKTCSPRNIHRALHSASREAATPNYFFLYESECIISFPFPVNASFQGRTLSRPAHLARPAIGQPRGQAQN